jgi:hypothetical protein
MSRTAPPAGPIQPLDGATGHLRWTGAALLADAVSGLAGPRAVIGLLLLSLLSLAACGGDGGGVTGPGADVSGTYVGLQTFSMPAGVTISLTLMLLDTAGQVNGSYSQSTGDRGSITGTASGTTFQAQSRSTVFGTTCAFSGGISGNGATLSGTFLCSSQDAGSFTVNRT